MEIFGLLLQMILSGYAEPVTRDQLGKLPAGPLADPFRPPPPDSKTQPEPWQYKL